MASIKKRKSTFSVIYWYLDNAGERKQKWDTLETKKEGRRSFIYSKVDESDYHKVQFEQMKKVWFDDSWDEFSVALSDVVKQEENDKLRRLIDDLDDSAD